MPGGVAGAQSIMIAPYADPTGKVDTDVFGFDHLHRLKKKAYQIELIIIRGNK